MWRRKQKSPSAVEVAQFRARSRWFGSFIHYYDFQSLQLSGKAMGTDEIIKEFLAVIQMLIEKRWP